MANRIAPAWLELFITSNNVHPDRNFVCIQAGACSAAEFKQGQAHAGHAYLQMRKHMLRNYVVNADDLTTFINTTETLNRYNKNGVSTFSLHARVYKRSPKRSKLWTRTCAVCLEAIRSEQLGGVIVCSTECLLRSLERVPIVVKDCAPTGMHAPRRRSRWDVDRERPMTPDATDIHPVFLKKDFVGEDELLIATNDAAPLFVEPIEALEFESESLEVRRASEEENEMHEVGALDHGITSASAEQMWTKAKECAIDATFEQNKDFNWSNAVSVWSAGTYVRFLTSILSHKDQVNLEEENEIPKIIALQEETETPKVGALEDENQMPKVGALREESEMPKVGVLEEETKMPKVGGLGEDIETPEAGDLFETEDGVISAYAEKMWNQAKKSAIDATFEQNMDRDWGNVVSVWSAGTYARFLSSILSSENRESGLVRLGRYIMLVM